MGSLFVDDSDNMFDVQSMWYWYNLLLEEKKEIDAKMPVKNN
ncbi:MAG TPA: hypothetical protein VN922_05190 [Bacteroidia bacterium]|nr:hypothetical protein [Bacteroidia bacterium]